MLYSLHPNFYLNCLLFQVKCRISQEAENSMRIQLQMQNSCSSQIAFFFPKWNQKSKLSKNTIFQDFCILIHFVTCSLSYAALDFTWMSHLCYNTKIVTQNAKVNKCLPFQKSTIEKYPIMHASVHIWSQSNLPL